MILLIIDHSDDEIRRNSVSGHVDGGEVRGNIWILVGKLRKRGRLEGLRLAKMTFIR
jgi:hypothetical protein